MPLLNVIRAVVYEARWKGSDTSTFKFAVDRNLAMHFKPLFQSYLSCWLVRQIRHFAIAIIGIRNQSSWFGWWSQLKFSIRIGGEFFSFNARVKFSIVEVQHQPFVFDGNKNVGARRRLTINVKHFVFQWLDCLQHNVERFEFIASAVDFGKVSLIAERLYFYLEPGVFPLRSNLKEPIGAYESTIAALMGAAWPHAHWNDRK